MWIHMNPMFHVTTFTIPVPVFNVQYVIELSSQEHPSESDNVCIVRGPWQQHEHISQHNGEVLHEEGILGGGGNKLRRSMTSYPRNSLWKETFETCVVHTVYKNIVFNSTHTWWNQATFPLDTKSFLRNIYRGPKCGLLEDLPVLPNTGGTSSILDIELFLQGCNLIWTYLNLFCRGAIFAVGGMGGKKDLCSMEQLCPVTKKWFQLHLFGFSPLCTFKHFLKFMERLCPVTKKWFQSPLIAPSTSWLLIFLHTSPQYHHHHRNHHRHSGGSTKVQNSKVLHHSKVLHTM